MSHFTVLVVLPKDTELEGVQDKLSEVLEPWNENTSVPEYRQYEEGSPADHWGYRSVCEKMLPSSEDPVAEVKPMTWAEYVPLFNERWAAEADDPLFLDEHTDRAYRMSTYNPLSKWDWWSIGGRWSNSLLAKPSVDLSALLWSPSHWTEQYGNSIPKGRGETGGYHCDAGRLCDLDLEAMEVMAVAKATEAYDEYAAAIGEHIGTTKPWSYFYDLSQVGMYDQIIAERNEAGTDLPDEGRRPWGRRDLAREHYQKQPGIQALDAHEKFRRSFGCVIEKFKLGRTEYIERARRNFLPGYAMVTLEGEWLSCGEMGWWGVGSDEDGTVDAHKQEMKTYLRDSVHQESIVVLVDCHI